MGISPKLLSDGEYVVVSTRTHWKSLVVPVLVLLLTCAAAGFLLAVVDGNDTVTWVILGVALVIVLWFSLWPFLDWLTSAYTVTNRRLINRSGVITRVGRDIPLYRINDVSYERGLIDRMFGCGTLVVAVASEEGKSVLPDVPRVEELQVTITDLLFGKGDGAGGDVTPPGEPKRR